MVRSPESTPPWFLNGEEGVYIGTGLGIGLASSPECPDEDTEYFRNIPADQKIRLSRGINISAEIEATYSSEWSADLIYQHFSDFGDCLQGLTEHREESID